MEDAACTIPTDFVDDFEAAPFHNTAQIEFFHRQKFRFGLSTNILDLMEGNEAEQKEYMRGVLGASISILVIAILWMLVLIVFKAMGPYRVGILSGRQASIRRKKIYDPSQNDLQTIEEEFQQDYDTAKKRLRIYRIMVIFAGMSIVISSILMSIKGVDSLTSSLDEGREGISIVSNLTQGGIDILDRVLEQNKETAVLVEDFLQGINGICPKVRDPICTNVNRISTCNFDGIVDQESVEAVVDHFRGKQRSAVYAELVDARKDLKRLLNIANDIDDQASQFNWALYCAMAFSLGLAALSIFILIGIVSGQSKMVSCIRSWILVPIFIVLVVLSFVFCLTFLIGSIVLADMCVDSPDPRIQVLLDRFEQELSPMLVEFVRFYINQCPEDQLPQELTDQLLYFRDAVDLVSDFTGMLAISATGGLQDICGFEEPDAISALAQSTNSNLCGVSKIIISIRQYFQCRNWYPLYETTVYEAMCYDGIEGFAWVSGTQFVVVFMAMVMLTLRGAFYDVEIIEPEMEDDSDSTSDSFDHHKRQPQQPRVHVHHHRDGVEISPQY